MFRRRRRERDLGHQDYVQTAFHTGEDHGQANCDANLNKNIRKSSGPTFELIPTSRDGNGIILQPPHSSPTLADPGLSQSSTDNPTFVSFIQFNDLVDLNTSPLSSNDTHPPTPALVYTAGGKAKSMYTVTRPASVRKYRDSMCSQPGTLCTTLPATSAPPVPALKLPSVKARHKQIPTFNICIAWVVQFTAYMQVSDNVLTMQMTTNA